MVVPVYLVTEDVVLSDDDGKQLSVRRSDLTPGENPGVQELGHPLCHLLTQQHYSMGKLVISGKETTRNSLHLTWIQVKMRVNHKTQIQELIPC